MPYVTSIERLGIKKGREEGREEGIEHGIKTGLRIGIQAVLEARFGETGRSLAPEIDAVDDRALLEKILDRAKTVAAPENLRECWR